MLFYKCYVGNPREVFSEFAKVMFLKVSRKLDIIIIMYRAATHCRLGSSRRRAPENFGLVLVQFPVWWCFWTITLPFIGSSRASKGIQRWGFATAKHHGPEAHPCTCRCHCLMMLFEVSRHKLQMQQPSFQKWGFATAKHQIPWCSLFLHCTPCWWPGSVNRDIFAKVLRRSGRKSKCILKGVG